MMARAKRIYILIINVNVAMFSKRNENMYSMCYRVIETLAKVWENSKKLWHWSRSPKLPLVFQKHGTCFLFLNELLMSLTRWFLISPPHFLRMAYTYLSTENDDPLHEPSELGLDTTRTCKQNIKLTTLCSSREYPYLPMEGIFPDTSPPFWKFQLSSV